MAYEKKVKKINGVEIEATSHLSNALPIIQEPKINCPNCKLKTYIKNFKTIKGYIGGSKRVCPDCAFAFVTVARNV